MSPVTYFDSRTLKYTYLHNFDILNIKINISVNKLGFVLVSCYSSFIVEAEAKTYINQDLITIKKEPEVGLEPMSIKM